MSEEEKESFVIEIPQTQKRDDTINHVTRPPASCFRELVIAADGVRNNPGLSIFAYAISSMSMTLVNKYVVSGQFWNLHFFFLAIQSVVSVIAITAAKQLGIITSLAPIHPAKVKRWFPISLLLVSMIYTGNKSLQFLSVPVYTIFKNMTIIVIAYGEVLWFGGTVSPLTLLAFGLMVLSSVVAAWADIHSAIAESHGTANPGSAVSVLNVGYAWMGLNIMCAASYALGMRRVIKSMGFKDWDSMYYNNLLPIPVLVICSLVTEEWSASNFARNFPEASRNHMIIGMVYSGLGAIFISYCSAWCIRVTTSTTYSMVGALNKLPLAIMGLIFFSAPVTIGGVTAIAIGCVSGVVYALARARR
ncbi:UDP-galactose transporter [Xylariales sp. PMI_506]|nr:UDP-galactose transporter [Xylariales sp. PMI_506]